MAESETKTFCERLRLAVEDEVKAGPEYRQTADKLYKEVESGTSDLGNSATDHAIIIRISGDEDRHHSLLKEMYQRRCTR